MLIPGPKHRPQEHERVPRDALQIVYTLACSTPLNDAALEALEEVRKHFDLRGNPGSGPTRRKATLTPRFLAATKLAVGVVAVVVLTACPNTTPSAPSDQSVLRALVSAGCMKDDDAALPALIAEHQLPVPPPWLNCLYSGGTVAGCAVPCSSGGE